MSIYQLVQICCDGDGCNEFLELHMPLASAKQDARSNGWQIKTSYTPDLCPSCKAKAEGSTGNSGQ